MIAVSAFAISEAVQRRCSGRHIFRCGEYEDPAYREALPIIWLPVCYAI
jgi:hypothetical protein